MHTSLFTQMPVLLQEEGGGGGSAVLSIIWFIVGILMIVAMWKVFTKAGKPGWAAIIPIYNIIVILQMIGRPVWWVILFLIPFVNLIIFVMVCIDVAKSFGKGSGFGIGLWLLAPIFWLILGFGDTQYKGPAAAS